MAAGGVTLTDDHGLVFAPGFNAAEAFIDRHLLAGRGERTAIVGASGEVSYAQLAAGVNRCASLLQGLGLARLGTNLLPQSIRTDRIIRLNLGARFPKQDLTLVVFQKNFPLFEETVKDLSGKKVRITGKVTEYQKRAQVVLERPDQLTVVVAAFLEQGRRRVQVAVGRWHEVTHDWE